MSDIRIVRNGQPQLVRVTNGESKLVRVISEGPQGQQGPPGPPGESGVTELNALNDVDVSEIQDRSMLVYDAMHGLWVANSRTTVDEVLNGGNF